VLSAETKREIFLLITCVDLIFPDGPQRVINDATPTLRSWKTG